MDASPRDVAPRLRAEAVPAWRPPMSDLPKGGSPIPNEIFERKFDGIRQLAFCAGDDARLRSRKQLALEQTYPETSAPLLPGSSPDSA